MVMSLGSARRARAMGCAAAILRDQRRVLPPQIVESFLAQSAAHPTLWRILTDPGSCARCWTSHAPTT